MLLLYIWGCQQDSMHRKQDFEPIKQVEHWCDGALGGKKSTAYWQQDFARAHVGQRLFSPGGDWLSADEILAAELMGVGDSSNWIESYADRFEHVCYIPAGKESGSSSLQMFGDVAVIQPGTDTITLPDNVNHLIIDLQNVGYNADIESAIGLAFSSDIQLGKRKVRRFLGFPSQEDSWTHYEFSQEHINLYLTGVGNQDIPLTFLTGQRMTPQASTLVGLLRMQEKVSVVGYDVFASVAESTWSGIEGNGLLWRSSELSFEGNVLPDRIKADREISSVEELIESLDSIEIQNFEENIERVSFQVYDRTQMPSDILEEGERKAGLLIAYGTLDWFYPYFDVVGRGIDDTLLSEWELVDLIEDGDRVAMMHSLGRLMHSIHDGHGFYSDWAGTNWPDGYLGIQVERINDEPVVRQSVHPEIFEGDTIVEIEGQSAENWYADTMSRYSASSEGYRFVQATYELTDVHGIKELTLRSVDGMERSISAIPQSYDEYLQVPWGGTFQESGWLTGVDGTNIFYVNMSNMVTPEMEPIIDQFDQIMEADGVILDMRDYPYLHIYEFARYFNPDPFTAPHFGFPTWNGPEKYSMPFEIWDFMPAPQVYTGPIVLLVSNKSVSAAECFAQMIEPLENVTVVGQKSAATNGTITNAWLPGQLQITWTGMDLKNLDGSDFHGIGIIPDITVEPTAEDFANGIDPELIQAIEVLSSQ